MSTLELISLIESEIAKAKRMLEDQQARLANWKAQDEHYQECK